VGKYWGRKLKVKCIYCGVIKYVPPNRVKSKKTYCCGSKECKGDHMRRIGKLSGKGVRKDFSQLKKLNNWAKQLGHNDLFMEETK
jgi:hypothetical protein